MRQLRPPGSVRGASSNARPYRDRVAAFGWPPRPSGRQDNRLVRVRVSATDSSGFIGIAFSQGVCGIYVLACLSKEIANRIVTCLLDAIVPIVRIF